MDDKFCWDILDIYFQHGGSSESVNPLIKHQIDSYNKFIDNTLSQIITGFNPIKIGHGFKQEVNDHIHKIYINVLQPSLTKPMYQLQDGTQTIMTPNIARMNNLTYSSNLYVNVHLVIEVINNDGVIEKIDKNINGVYIGKIPVMVRSKACILSQIQAIGEENNNECKYDFGGYFIINGNEKCLVSQDRINENKTLVFQPNNNSDGLYAEIRSMSDSTYLPPKTTSLNMSGKLNHMGRIIRMSTSFLRNEIPIFIMFRALGVISDQEIIQHIVYDLDNKDNYRIINELMACCEDACDVHTQEQAENVLIKIMTGVNKTVNSKELLSSNIINDFLPHVGKNYRRKALYLGYMIRRMIRIYIGYDTYDNRDSYMNKRIDTPGILMSNLFRQCYGKMTKEMKNLIERELNLWRANQSVPTSEIITDANIHRYFKQSLLDSWLKYSLSTGNWGIKSIGSFQNIRQGVSQVLNRMSYASTLSHLRRINTAMEKNGKLVQPRKLDNSQMGMICPAETPEGASVGLVKNLALSTQVSVSMSSAHIRLLLQEFGVIHYNDSYNYNITSEEKWFESNPSIDEARNNITYFLKEMGNYNNVYIQINGDIIGYHTNPVELYNKLKHYKRCGIIHPMTSIIWNIKYRYIYISTEAGRMYRPLLIVDIDKDTGVRELRIAKILREKKLTWEEYIKDKSFDSFVCPIVSDNECSMEEEGFIEYMDCEEINYAMIAINPIELTKGAKGTALPALYTHCEIHPSLINGILGVNVPFSDHNQSPRNCYQCLWENEEVLMSDGTTKMIKDINIGDYVLTFDPETIIVSNTVVVNHMLKDTDKNIVKLTTYSGREIILTDDHNVITNEGWKPSAEFTENTKVGILCDNIYIKKFYENLENKIVLDEETFIQNMKNANIKESLIIKHIKNLKKLSLIPLMNDDDRLPILAGLFGYITTDGSVNIYNKKHGGMTAQVSVTLGRLLDAEKMNEDIAKLGFKLTRINEATRIHPSRGVKHHTFDICYNGMFASYMIGLGIDYGKKTEIQRKPLPEWIVNGSKETKRHFLAGFQGGDGCKIAIYNNIITLAQTSQQIIPEYSESLEQFMAQIVNMFNEFSIETKMRSNKIVTDNNNKIKVAYYISNNYDNLIKYYETIGYKYSNTKNTKSAISIEYLKYKKLSNKRCTDINIDDWVNNVEIKGEGIFMPVTITSHKNVRVCDIEVEHKNHSFLTSSGVMISNCAMGKQALGVYMSNFNKRIDTMGSVLNYPQKPLAYTKLSKYTYSNDLPSGINSVVAIMTHTGFNQEDSVMINKSALDRGLYVSTYYKAFRDQCTKNHSTGEEEIFTNPKNSVSLKPYSYEKLDESGFVPKNTYVDGNDIIVGKVMPKKNNGVITQQDNSMCMKANDEGYIDLNYTGVNSEGYKFCKVRVRKNRKPEIGDKLASRSAQKGTIGMVYNHQDMPFTKDGIVPDIIMNPHAIPSRMTMGQLMECIMGKAACHIGSTGDATPFTDCSVESIAKVLEMSGMERYGNEIMYCGRTGEQIQTEIFIGPTYYQRLKHMVQDKLHCTTADHEVLTTEGWKFIPEVTMEDKVATLKDGKLVYENPLEIHHYPNYKGKMYKIKNQGIDLNVTANHRMYISTCHTRQKEWSEYRLEKAEDIIGKFVKYKKNAEWDAPNYQFVLPAFDKYEEKVFDMKSWITFFGIWIAEGWAYNGKYENKYRIGFAVNKQRVKDVLYDAINKLGYTYNVCEEHLEINNKQLHAYLAPLSVGAPNKRLPEWVWSLSKEQAQHLVISMQLGDGCFDKKTTGSIYYTSSVGLSDDFMRLLLHAGWSGMKTIHIKAGESKVQINERDISNNYDIWRISVIKSKNEPCVNHSHHKKQNIQEEELYDYEGSVYCLSVSSEVFMVRRNGKPVWTGNSRGSNGPIVMLTRQPSEGRARNGGLRLGEMERDCLVAHGMSSFLKERMLDVSDNYRLFICKTCGVMANVNPDNNIYQCKMCGNQLDISQVRMPYAFKLLSQELATMNILMRFAV